MFRAFLVAALIAMPSLASAATLFAQGVASDCGGHRSYIDQATSSDNAQVGCSGETVNGIWETASMFAARSSFGSIGIAVGALGVSHFETGFGWSQSDVSAIAYATDYVFSSVTSGYLSIPVDVAGSIATAMSGSGIAYGQAQVLMQVVVHSPNFLFDSVLVFSSFTYNSNDGIQIETVGALGVTNVLIPIVDGLAAFSIQMNAEAICATPNEKGGYCSHTADFYNSARLLAATVLDDNFNTVVGATLSSESGFDYSEGVTPHPSPVPLPASALLLISGLTGVGGLQLRRRRATG